jgi:Ca-activated chloride channel family protein
VTCPSHETVVRFDNPAMADVMLKNGSGYGGDRDYILRYRLSDDKIQSGLMLYSGIRGNYFLMTVQPPRRVAVDDIPPREYVFVVDVSGSMHGFPLDVSKTLLKNLIGSLRPSDTFNVVLFAGASRVMAPSSIPATPSNIEAALRTIDEEGGGGGTELPAAMDTAFGIPKNPAVSRSMIVVTDGYIDAEKEVFEKIRSHLSGTNVFAFGIGSSVNRYLIEGIAHAGQGEPFVVSDPSEAPAAAKRFCDYVREPLLKDIRLDVEGFEAYDLEPSAIPDMFSRRPIVVVGRWKGEAKGTLRVTGNSAQGAYVQTFRVADAKPVDENRPIRSLWARTRITRLSQDGAGPDNSSNKDEITTLGLEYSLLTQYTSFVAVHETVRNPDGAGKDVKQPLPLPKGVSPLAVGGDYTSVPEPGLGLMLLLMAGVAIRSMKGRAAGIRK